MGCGCRFMLTGSGTLKIPLSALEQTRVMLQEMSTYHACVRSRKGRGTGNNLNQTQLIQSQCVCQPLHCGSNKIVYFYFKWLVFKHSIQCMLRTWTVAQAQYMRRQSKSARKWGFNPLNGLEVQCKSCRAAPGLEVCGTENKPVYSKCNACNRQHLSIHPNVKEFEPITKLWRIYCSTQGVKNHHYLHCGSMTLNGTETKTKCVNKT